MLVVDDDPLVLRNTTVALEDAGHAPTEASSGQAALDMLDGKPEVDIVVTDYLMPGMNGLQLAEKIRTQRPELPILIASAYGDLSSSDLKLPKLQKPFAQHELLQSIAAVLNEAVGRHQRSRAAPAAALSRAYPPFAPQHDAGERCAGHVASTMPSLPASNEPSPSAR